MHCFTFGRFFGLELLEVCYGLKLRVQPNADYGLSKALRTVFCCHKEGSLSMDSIRDKLALERTRLANERTFLAYVRTALSLIAGAAILFEFFSTSPSYLVVAWFLAVMGVIVFFIGIYRFRAVRSELRVESETTDPG